MNAGPLALGQPPSPPTSRPLRPVSLVILGAVVALLGYLSGFPAGAGVVVAVLGVALAVALRMTTRPSVASCAPIPVLFAMIVEAATAPITYGTEILAGLAGLAFLVWLADDPARPVGGLVRGLPVVALPALALGIAWLSAIVLPAGAVPFGVAGALLAVTIAALAFLVGSPGVFDREEARS